jgi:uncharacterized ferredoxin-like protein
MIQNERTLRKTLVLQAAHQMMVAARTAPKGKGVDILEIALVTDSDIPRLSDEMRQIATTTGHQFFHRDADNLQQADAVLILGTRHHPQNLNCHHCGYPTCATKPPHIPCALNTLDLGIALGSASAKAADLRVDTRIMFSAGLAAQHLQMLGPACQCVMAIPISITSKNPFFDRKPTPPQPQ